MIGSYRQLTTFHFILENSSSLFHSIHRPFFICILPSVDTGLAEVFLWLRNFCRLMCGHYVMSYDVLTLGVFLIR